MYFHKMALLPKKEIEAVCTCIASSLGYSSLREHQENVITKFIAGNDVFVVLQTGRYGKSLCHACLLSTSDKLLNVMNSTLVIIQFASD